MRRSILGTEASEDVRGHVHNVSLPAFLQLMEMERKTCRLTVHSEGRTGTLFLRRGELLDARLEGLCGSEAAMAILSFTQPGITIEASSEDVTRSIDWPLRYLLMEAMRVSDELGRDDVGLPTSILPTSIPPPPVRLLARGVQGVLIVEVSTGLVIAGQTRFDVNSTEVALGAATLVRHERSLLGMVGGGDELREVVINTRTRTELIRTIEGDGSHLAVLLFDPEETNLVMARIELELFLAELAGQVR